MLVTLLLPPTRAQAKRFQHLKWFGKGPQESYADRQKAAKLGIYNGRVSEQLHPYLRPQESGNKVGVRWAALQDPSRAEALWVSAPPESAPLSLSALPYATDDLDVGNDKDIVIKHHLTKCAPRRARGRGVRGDAFSDVGELPCRRFCCASLERSLNRLRHSVLSVLLRITQEARAPKTRGRARRARLCRAPRR
eukprot:6193709-Pleurochrysis_carterae.AAC.3